MPGTNHVQSTNECTPKTSDDRGSVSSPMRSGVYGAAARRRGRRPVVRAAAASHATNSARLIASPRSPRSASVWTT